MNLITHLTAVLVGIFFGSICVVLLTVLPSNLINHEIIISGSSIAIALCALLLTFWQTYTSQRHQRLTLEPSLDFNSFVSDKDKYFTISLFNHGLGPAIIKKLSVIIDSKEVQLDSYSALADVIAELIQQSTKSEVKVTNITNGSKLPSNGNVEIINYQLVSTNVDFSIISQQIKGKVELIVDYVDLYGKSFNLQEKIF